MAHVFTASVPARINMLGNPGDGNEGDLATISAAIQLHASVKVTPVAELTVQLPGEESVCPPGDPPFALHGGGGLALAAINRLWGESGEFRDAWGAAKPSLAFHTEVPWSSGLAGSSLIVLLTLAAVREFYGLPPRLYHDYLLGELAQQVEEHDLGITCGFADRYVPLFGGLAYLDYRGKLWHKGIDHEPLVTYERLDRWVEEFPVVVVYTGVLGESGDVHHRFRGKYLKEAREFGHRPNPGEEKDDDPYLIRTMAAVGATAWRGKAALLRGDWAEVGRLMTENHRLVNEAMHHCEFTEGAGDHLNRLIAAAMEGGALGAKLTGAGGRGSIFVVTRPGQEAAMAASLQTAARESGLAQARVFPALLDREGLVIEAGA